jgi:hypothetical protein
MQQLDIFADSRDRVLLNTLAEALLRDEVAASRTAAAVLGSEFPDDRHLGSAALLIEALAAEATAGAAPLPHAAAALAGRAAIEQTLQAAAATLLGAEAAAGWLASRWRALARRAVALPYDADSAPAHAAGLWLQGRAWAEALVAVESIESWRRRAQPLAWMAEAVWHLRGPDRAWPLLAELAWLAPLRLPDLLARLPDRRLHKLAQGFEAAFETGPDWAWWPAWLLVEQPLLAAALDGALAAGETPPERGYQLMQALLRLERQGRHAERVALRQQLRGLYPELFAAYMATR